MGDFTGFIGDVVRVHGGAPVKDFSFTARFGGRRRGGLMRRRLIRVDRDKVHAAGGFTGVFGHNGRVHRVPVVENLPLGRRFRGSGRGSAVACFVARGEIRAVSRLFDPPQRRVPR